MTKFTTTPGRTARRLTIVAVPLLVASTGTAAAMGGSYSGGMMGGGGLFGGILGLWGLLWMVLLLAVPVYLVYTLARRRDDGAAQRPVSVLRERYARGELSDDEFERRRAQLGRAG